MLFLKSVALIALPLLISASPIEDDVKRQDLTPYADITRIHDLQPRALKTGAACACAILDVLFGPTSVLTKGNGRFVNETTHYWDERNFLQPACVFVPSNTKHVAKGIVVMGLCQSQFSVRSGGHMPVQGASSSNGGVLIALTCFKNVKVSKDLKSVDAGSGATWFDVYDKLEKHGLIAIGGRHKTVGVGGLALGGGISFFTSKYGFAMDNVISYEVVTSNGKILTASAKANSDLFWALKGGGNNFGIVTNFKLATYKAPKISTVMQIRAGESLVDSFLTASINYALHHQKEDIGSGAIFNTLNVPTASESNGVTSPVLILRFEGAAIGDSKSPKAFRNVTSIPGVIAESKNVSTLAEYYRPQHVALNGGRNAFAMHAMTVDEAALKELWSVWKAASDKMTHVKDFYSGFTIQSISKSAAEVGKRNGVGNIWSLDSSKPYIWWNLITHWKDPKDDKELNAFHRMLTKDLHAVNIRRGTAAKHLYYNDCDGSQDAFASYPSKNLKKLRQIRGKYDPQLMFTKLASGGFKIKGDVKY